MLKTFHEMATYLLVCPSCNLFDVFFMIEMRLLTIHKTKEIHIKYGLNITYQY